MRMPGTDDLSFAIAWLRVNEGGGLEAKACALVADWIEHEETERYIRSGARQVGVPIAVFRKRFNEKLAKS